MTKCKTVRGPGVWAPMGSKPWTQIRTEAMTCRCGSMSSAVSS